MERIAILTDSSSDIPKKYIKELNIKLIPLYIHYNGNEYRDGIDIDSNTIYNLQKNKKAVFTSSAPSPHDFLNIYKELLRKYEKIISIHISSKLSGVIKAAFIAKDFLEKSHRVELIDSLMGSMGTGFLAMTASKAIRSDYNFKRIIDSIDFLKKNIKLFGTINTLEYLKRSGRVPEFANLFTNITKIKPILGIEDGLVKMISISISRRGSVHEITKRALKEFKDEKWVLASVIHSLSLEESKKVMNILQKSLNIIDPIITECTPIVGAHTGPGLIGIIISRLNYDLAKLYI